MYFMISDIICNGLIDNKSALLQVSAWCQTGDKILFNQMAGLVQDCSNPVR